MLAWLTDCDGPPPADQSIAWLRLSDSIVQAARRRGDTLAAAPGKSADYSSLVGRRSLAAWLHVVRSVPGPRECRGGDPLGGGLRRGASRLACARRPTRFIRAASRAAGPALYQVPLMQGPPLEALRVDHHPLIALDTTGPEIGEAPFPETFGLVVGAEGPGLPFRCARASDGGSPCSLAWSRSTPRPPPQSPSMCGPEDAESRGRVVDPCSKPSVRHGIMVHRRGVAAAPRVPDGAARAGGGVCECARFAFRSPG